MHIQIFSKTVHFPHSLSINFSTNSVYLKIEKILPSIMHFNFYVDHLIEEKNHQRNETHYRR